MTNERSTPCDISEVPEQPTNQTLLDHQPDVAPDTKHTVLSKTAILNFGTSVDNFIAKSLDPTGEGSLKSQISEQLSQMRDEDIVTAILALSDKETDTARPQTPCSKGPFRHRSKSRSHRAISITPRVLSDKETERSVYTPISLRGRIATPSGSDGKERMVPEIHPTCGERQHFQTRPVTNTPPDAASKESGPEIKADSAPRLQVCEESTSSSNIEKSKNSRQEVFAASDHLEHVSRLNSDYSQQETRVELEGKLFSYNQNTDPASANKELLAQGIRGPQNATEKKTDVPGVLGVSRTHRLPEQLALAGCSSCSCSPMQKEEAQMGQAERNVPSTPESVSTAGGIETPLKTSPCNCTTPISDRQEQVIQRTATTPRRTNGQPVQLITEEITDMTGVSQVQEQPQQLATVESPLNTQVVQMRQGEQGASKTLQGIEGISLDVARSEESVSTARAIEKPQKACSDRAVTPTSDQQERVVRQAVTTFRGTKDQPVQHTTDIAEKPTDRVGISCVEEQPEQLATAKSPISQTRKLEKAQTKQVEQGASKTSQRIEGISLDVARSEESVSTARAIEKPQKASLDRTITPTSDQQERVVRQAATTHSGTEEQSAQCKERTFEEMRKQCQLGIISQHEYSTLSTRETPQRSIDSMMESKTCAPSNQQGPSVKEAASLLQAPRKSEESGPQQQQESDLLAVNSHRERWYQDGSKTQKRGVEQAISAAKYQQAHDKAVITTASEKSPRRKSVNLSRTHDDQGVTTAVARSPEAKPTGFSLGSLFPSLFGHSAPTDDSSSTSSAPVTGPPAVLRRPITFTYPEQPVRPKNPRRDVIRFRSEYANNFTLGSRHTVDFYGGSYDDVQREARNAVKLIVVFIHDPSLEESIRFINDSLNSVEFGELVNKHNLLLWGVGNNTEEGKFVAYNLHVNKFPFLGLMCPRADNRFFSVRRITGFVTAQDLVMRLEKAIEVVRVDLKDLREQRDKLLEDRRLMQEQEKAYRESAEKDKQRMLAAKKARQEKEEAEMREKRKQNEEKERRTLIANQREMLRKQVDDKPCGKETVRIQVRFPSGKKFTRQFALDDSLEKLFTAIMCHETCPDFFTVATGFPRAEVNCAPEWYHLVLSEQLIAEGSKPKKFKPPLTFRAAGFNRPVGVFVNSYG